ncbi:MAG: zinc dependent phospholipase C family protein [Chloroflexi bacterium]|nr:zinc dependent phospholipase C family protein [Chloroflexota bacterium]
MPNLPMHIFMAQQAAERLDWGFAYDCVGSFYLGSTAPDIRAMTKWPRDRTHFAGLSVQTVGEGARRMLELHPEMNDPAALNATTRAFMLGYISHLVADEVWITTMFRPHFDPSQPDSRVTSSESEAHIWDRALQLEMDRRAFGAMEGFTPATQAIDCSDPALEVGFLETEVLLEWRGWVQGFLGREFTWDRLKRALNRMYRDNDDVQSEVDRFLEQMPFSMEKVYEKIPEEKLAAYQERALEETVSLAREYLSGT